MCFVQVLVCCGADAEPMEASLKSFLRISDSGRRKEELDLNERLAACAG